MPQLTLEEQKLEVAKYAQAFGAIVSGNTKRDKFGINQFELVKEGFENRWSSLCNLRKEFNPFGKASLDEQKTEFAKYAKALGATFTGNTKRSKHSNLFELSKEGYENRWATLGDLRSKRNPFNRASLNEQIKELNSYLKNFGAFFTGGIKRRGRNNLFELAKEGYENRWVVLGSLRDGSNPFSKPTLNEQIKELEGYLQAYGAIFTGNVKQVKQGKHNYFELSKEGYENRWATLGSIRKGQDPFKIPTIEEQIEELEVLIKPLQATFTGNVKREKHNYFELSKEGFDIRWVVLQNLRKGINPFNRASLNEQIEEIKHYAKLIDAIFTGNTKIKCSCNYFELSREGFENRWITLGNLKKGVNPFNKPTLSEQKKEVKLLALKIDAIFTGNCTRGSESDRKFELSKKGLENKWITLSGLRIGQNPWADGGYDPDKAGDFYWAPINDWSYIGYGISNNADRRTTQDHDKNLAKAGYTHGEWNITHKEDGHIPQDAETEVKRYMREHGFAVNLDVDGFRREAFTCTQSSMIAFARILAKYGIEVAYEELPLVA